MTDVDMKEITGDFISLTISLPVEIYDYILDIIRNAPPNTISEELDVSKVCSSIVCASMQTDMKARKKAHKRLKVR